MDQSEFNPHHQLPDECLLLVIQTFAADLKALRKLLLVNRFFFHVTVPLMLDNPFDTWEMNDEGRKRPSIEKLVALIFASVVSHNRGPPPPNDPNPAATAHRLTAEFLKPFNLRVADIICLPMVKFILEKPHNKTTIDYSRYFKNLHTFKSDDILFSGFVQLHRPSPEAIDREDHTGLLVVFGGIDSLLPGGDDGGSWDEEDDEDEGEGSWEDEDDEEFDFFHEEEESYDEEDSEEEPEEDLDRGANERKTGPSEPFYSDALLAFTKDFGLGFAQQLASSPIGALEESSVDDSGSDMSDGDSKSNPMSSFMLPGSMDYWALPFDESSAKYFNDFGFIDKDCESKSHNNDSDMDDDDDGLDPKHKEVRKLGRRIYDKWRLTNMQQMFDGYLKAVSRSLVGLLVQYNADIITDIHFHLKEAHFYIGSATKMPQLQKVFLARDKTVILEDLEDTKQFFRTHRTAFPEKRLALIFDQSWDYETHYRRSLSSTQSRTLIEFERPRMEIYQAVQNIHILIVDGSPKFYENCTGVNLSCLVGFRDNDDNRCMTGEGPAQERFLRQCTNLRWVVLNIDSPQHLAWMSPSSMIGGSSAPTANPGLLHKPFEALGKLCLLTDYGSSILLHAANAAMEALSGSTHLNYLRIAGEYEKEREDEGPAGLVLSTGVGGWNLPAIRSIEIDVKDLDYLHINSLNQCPMLERLRLATGPITVGGSRSRSQPLQVAICEPWTLPRLKLLQLCNAPALLFNYDSLKSMPLLKVLVLVAMDDIDSGAKKQMWQSINKVPRLSAYLPSQLRIQDPTLPISRQKWVVDWHLENLSTLIMRGPPAMTFSMDWLKRCPALDRAVLKVDHGHLQPLPLHADNSVEWVTSPQESRLREFTLQGRWAMSSDDLTSFLADYAPNLVKLAMDRIHENKNVSAAALLKAIDRADKIVLDREQQRLAREASDSVAASADQPEVPHRKLVHVVARYGMRGKDLESWKLKAVPKTYEAKLREHHIRVYAFSKKHMVSGRTHRDEIVALGSKSQNEIAEIFSRCRDPAFSRYY
ncbi:hypothetical protein BGZ82_008967 [Podila clonocystis]|nr:hypothetical protein BGZ82_008967 [Podila clonocystis]